VEEQAQAQAQALSSADFPNPGRLLAPTRSLKKTLQAPAKPIRSHRTELHTYFKMYYQSKLRGEVTKAMENTSNSQRLKVQMEIARAAYEKEPAEVKEKVRAQMEEARAADAAANAGLGEWGSSDDFELLKM